MASQSRKRAEVFVARNKRTGDRYPARVTHLANKDVPVSSLAPYLHYTGNTQLQVCRCFRAQDHDRAHLMSDDDKNLAIAITRYMDKFSTDSSNQPDFYCYYERQKIEWAVGGVHAESFHYLSKGKDVVCRCDRHEHLNFRKVHSLEIHELCAEFFQNNTTETTCTREQWRAVDIRDSESLRRVSIQYTDSEPLNKHSTPKRDSFEYDPGSMVELLKNREKRPPSSSQRSSRPSPGSRRRHSREKSRSSGDVAHLSNGSNGEVDIPKNVWRMSRPSVYIGRHKNASLVSTLLGSLATSVQQNAHVDPAPRGNRPSTLDLVTEVQGAMYPADAWYSFSHSPGSFELGSSTKYPSPHAACSPHYNSSFVKSEFDIASLEVSFNGTPRPSTSGSVPTVQSDGVITHVAELPSPGMTAELDTTPTRSPLLPPHSPTLLELEGDSCEYVAELTGRRPTVQLMMPKIRTTSRRLTRLIEQPLWDAKLPNQEDFFLKWIQVCSRARPAPISDCSLCQNSFHTPDKRTIRLTCGHYVHHECLMSNFRVLDYEFGNCPICGMALCERSLHDRIDTDREAIFGQSFTNLSAEERIEFAQRGESVVCWSEEEAAAAQLRLLKDYVDVHADELYRQWRQTCFEPDWHNAVVLPVVQLFKGWNLPTRKNMYFSDCDTFYELVVWAELVRLMNTVRDEEKRIQGEGAPFPQLSKLHRKFMWAKDQYETEKQMWPANRSGMIECEKVAQDAFSIAVNTHLGRRT